ncbi:MAG: hypothetical protein ABFD54_06070 [Armatimonadota bacterium]|nr:hypothetical protein [bacterium]
MRKTVLILVGLFVLATIAAAQTTTPSGTSKMTGKMLNMKQTSVGKRMGVTGNIMVGSAATKGQWTVRAIVRGARPNTRVALAAVDADRSVMLGSPKTTDKSGNAILTWSGITDLRRYTDIAVYSIPKTGDKPGSGALRLMSVKTSALGSTGAGVGAGPTKAKPAPTAKATPSKGKPAPAAKTTPAKGKQTTTVKKPTTTKGKTTTGKTATKSKQMTGTRSK